MKILFVITSMRTGGAERLVADLVPEMKRLGHAVDIFLFDGTETPLLRELKKHVSISYGAKGALQMWNPFHFFKLKKLIHYGDYDIVHSHNSPAQILTSLAVKNPNTKFVTTEHNTFTNRRKFTFLKWLDPIFYKGYDHIVCVSTKTRDSLMEDVNISPDKVTVITNGIDISKFSPDANLKSSKPAPKINPGDKIILMAGAFRKQKDQPTLIRAMAFLPSNYKLWLAGGWKLKRKSERLSQSLGLNDRISFMGIRNDIPALMQFADVNVLSTHYEGMPLSAIEAMASGKPFIASDVAGVREIASDAALLVPEANPEVLAKAIKEVIENQKLSSEISKKCRQRAIQFDIKNSVKAHISLYNYLCR